MALHVASLGVQIDDDISHFLSRNFSKKKRDCVHGVCQQMCYAPHLLILLACIMKLLE